MTKTIEIADWDSPSQMLSVEDGATIAQVLQRSGRTLSASQRVAMLNTNEMVSLNDLAKDGESYIITQNHVSG